jgi:hypothetical protein
MTVQPIQSVDLLLLYERIGWVTLSSLSTALEIALVLSLGTPQIAKIPSRILRWLSYWGSGLRFSISAHVYTTSETHFDCIFAYTQLVQDFASNTQDFRVGNHGVISTSDVEILYPQ